MSPVIFATKQEEINHRIPYKTEPAIDLAADHMRKAGNEKSSIYIITV